MHNSSVNVWVDEIVPCLKESATQEIKETVVFRIETKSFLEQFNEKRQREKKIRKEFC